MELLPYQVIVQAMENNDIAMMEKGRETCLAILQRSPDHLACLRLIAGIDYQLGDFVQAAKWFEEALAIQPDSAELCYNYGLSLVGQKKYMEAIAALQRGAELNPQEANLFYHMGILWEATGNRLEAIAAYQRASQLAPQNIEILNRLGTVLMADGDLVEAEQCFRRVLVTDPNYADALNNLGNILYCQGEFEQSIAFFKRALVIQPDYGIPLGNLAASLEAAGRLTEAIAAYRQVIALQPECLDFHTNLSMALLADGQMEEGWREFEWRTELMQLFSARPEMKNPRWQGEAGNGQILLIRGEQGYGDTLQFCRYAPLAVARGLRVVVEVQPPLSRLLKSLPGVEQIIAYGDALPEADYYCPMMSLPLIFSTQLATIPGLVPYLTVSEESQKEWQQRMPTADQNTLKVGIVWAGKRRDASLELAAADGRRSIDPSLFAPLLAVPGIQFYSLQKVGPEAPTGFTLVDMMDECDDFADTAALMMNLDLIISVDTAVAHLAGALGKKVWLLNRFDSCWRWLKIRGDSPWYPTMRIFRQSRPGDWQGVMECVQKELQAISSSYNQ